MSGTPADTAMTPLIQSHRLADAWGLRSLWLKNETVGISGSFKDRGAIVAVRETLLLGYHKIMTASSGNAGAAIAAHAARCGLDAIVVVDSNAPPHKVQQIQVYGADVRVIPGLFNQPTTSFVQTLQELAQREEAYLAFFWEPVNSAIIQGFEVIAEEIVGQLKRAPDVVIIPTGGGDHLVAHGRAYLRLWRQHRISQVPQLIAVQPEGACPLVDAINKGDYYLQYRPNPRTIASGLRVAFSGQHALELIRTSYATSHRKHTAIAVSDRDLSDAQQLLARYEGLWVEPSGVAGLAAIPQLLDRGTILPTDVIVVPLTGAGWKDR